jgi:hypothetical protein
MNNTFSFCEKWLNKFVNQTSELQVRCLFYMSICLIFRQIIMFHKSNTLFYGNCSLEIWRFYSELAELTLINEFSDVLLQILSWTPNAFRQPRMFRKCNTLHLIVLFYLIRLNYIFFTVFTTNLKLNKRYAISRCRQFKEMSKTITPI